MTTASSPVHFLRKQAERVAGVLKAVERGESTPYDRGGKLVAARTQESARVAVVMDDKVITIVMPWTTIRDTSEAGIVEYIVKQMQGKKDHS